MPATLSTPREIRSKRTVEAIAQSSPVWRSPWLWGPGSGFLLYLAFPPADRFFLAWVALVPLFALVTHDGSKRTIYLSAWLGGLVFWIATLIWIWELHPAAWLAWVALAAYQSVFWPLFVLFGRTLTRRFRLPLLAAAPVAWVACEYVQAHALSGFPWYYLAHAQYRVLPLIQISDLVGAWGVSALVALGNAWVFDLISQPWLRRSARRAKVRASFLAGTIAVAALMGASLTYGAVRLNASLPPGPRVVLLQSNLRQALKMQWEPERILAIYADLIRQAFPQDDQGNRPSADLIVWPETSFPFGFVRIEPGLPRERLDRAAAQIQADKPLSYWLDLRAGSTETLRLWSREANCPMLVGSPLYELTATGGSKSNAALWVDGQSGPIDIYRKMHLVPFGEYIPLLEVLPWIKRLAPYDDDRMPRLKAGRDATCFEGGEYRYATAICFEDTLPHVVRRFFNQGQAPDVLVNISNDGWFNGSAEHDLHLAIGVFRAVECRRPVLRAVNMGYSAVIDGSGNIRNRLEKKTQGVLVETIPLDKRGSLYLRVGDVLPQGCLAICLAAVGCSLILRRPIDRVGSRNAP